MPGIALGLIVGSVAAAAIPGASWQLLLAVVALAFTCRRWWRPMLACVAGLILATATLQARLDDRLDPAFAGRDVVVQGTVVGLPERDDRRLRFELLPQAASLDGQVIRLPTRLRLSWYGRDTAAVVPGELWRLSVRLRTPRGFANPGGFDYAGWLLRRGIGATGYVRPEPEPQRLAAAGGSIDVLRSVLRRSMQPGLTGLEHAGVLLAITLGDRSRIDPAAWQTLVATGTNHLMAISGLHIGLVALLGYLVAGGPWRSLTRFRPDIPRPVFQAVFALVLATVYAALAGFALPTVRALVMLVIALGALCLRRRVRPASVLAAAAVAVLLTDPLAVLDPGFWLSFGAVAAIGMVVAGRLERPRRLAGWIRLQLAIFLALTPLLLGLFREASVVAPVANLVAVPWVSMLTVPGALAGATLTPVWPTAGGMLLNFADLTLQALWWLLEWLADLPISRWRAPAFPLPLLVLAAVGAVCLLLPRGVPGRILAVAALLPLALWSPPRPPVGGVWLDVLDVGQGLATVVRTHRHTLVYDAGPRFSVRFDTGDAVVNPFLQAVGVERLDALVISHGDNDHAGGASSVRTRYPPRQAWSSVPWQSDTADRFCARGRGWTWDGVRFSFLHPGRDGGWQGNDGSCVLRIDAAAGSILLPGDIERDAERHLVDSAAPLAADVVVAPHHGSSTSSTSRFVRAVRPAWVLYPVGHDNQWDFPHREVIERWRPAGRARTDCGGALHVRIEPGSGVTAPRAWRHLQSRPWTAGCAASVKSGTMRAFEPPAAASPDADARSLSADSGHHPRQ